MEYYNGKTHKHIILFLVQQYQNIKNFPCAIYRIRGKNS